MSGSGLSAAVDGGAEVADEAGRALRSRPLEQPAHERRADDGAVGDRAHLGGLLGRRDPDADKDRLVGDRLAAGRDRRRGRRQVERSPVTPSVPTP